MQAVIRERVQADSQGVIHISHPQLLPGELIEVTLRSVPANEATSPTPSFLDVLSTAHIEAPADYSVNFYKTLS
jgi:hypothetical protein